MYTSCYFHIRCSIFAAEYAIRRVSVNQRGFKLNGTDKLLVYADNVNILFHYSHQFNTKLSQEYA